MSKIICDICGTTYQDTAPQCPICGCTRDSAASLLAESFVPEETMEEPKAKNGKYSTKKREIFDFDEVNTTLPDTEIQEEVQDYEEEEEGEEEESGHNVFVVILLTVLIFALLAVAGFLFVRYFLPNMGADETTAPVQTQIAETTAGETTELTIPCQTLVMTSGTAELNEAGQYFLLHVIAMPEDTTDPITYASADESIATVTEDGRITAVAEGETVIYITCGSKQLQCPVVCKFVEETTEATVDETGAAEGTEATDGSEETASSEETVEATVVPTEEADKSGITLKLKKSDITLGVYLQFTLELDCNLKPTDVEWSSEHPHIAKVDENGVVTAVKSGTTMVHAKYGSQEVTCWIRVP